MRRALTGIARGRRRAEQKMMDSCRVERPGAPATDPVSGKVTRPAQVIYEGKCELQQTRTQATTPNNVERDFTVQETSWKTPVFAGPFDVGDMVYMTAAAADPQLVGRQYRVTEPFHKSLATAQRCGVEEVT